MRALRTLTCSYFPIDCAELLCAADGINVWQELHATAQLCYNCSERLRAGEGRD